MDKRLIGITTVGLALASLNGHAQSYRLDFGAQFLTGCVDALGIPDYTPPTGGAPEVPTETPETPETTLGAEDYTGWGLAGDVFLGDVDTSKGPLQLAPFMSRASSIGGSYQQLETDDSDLEVTTWLINGRFVTSNGIVVEATFGQREDELGGFSDDVDLFGATLGYYVRDNTEVAFTYEVGDGDFEESDRYAVSMTHVQQLENGMTWSLDAQIGFADFDRGAFSEDAWDLSLNGAWFFNDATSVGLEFDYADFDETGELTAFEVYGRYFVTEKISLTLAYRDESYDEADLDSDALTFEARYRF